MRFRPFHLRPVATGTIARRHCAGACRLRLLPEPRFAAGRFPVIMVSASLPGASPETMKRGWRRRWFFGTHCRRQ